MSVQRQACHRLAFRYTAGQEEDYYNVVLPLTVLPDALRASVLVSVQEEHDNYGLAIGLTVYEEVVFDLHRDPSGRIWLCLILPVDCTPEEVAVFDNLLGVDLSIFFHCELWKHPGRAAITVADDSQVQSLVQGFNRSWQQAMLQRGQADQQ